MAESSDKIFPSKRRPLHFLFRCFGSSPKFQTQKPPATSRRNRRISSPFFRFKKSSATVPVDAAVPCLDDAFFSPEFKKPPPPRPPLTKSKTEIVELTKPRQSRRKTELTQSVSTAERFSPGRRTAALLHTVSFPSRRLNHQKDLKKSASPLLRTAATASSDRRLKKSASPLRTAVTATSRRRNPPANSTGKKFDLVILIVAVASVVLWGRICAILCTATLFYVGRRVRSVIKQDGGGGGGIGGVS